MNIFDKTKGLGIVHLVRRLNLYPYFRKLDGSSGSNVVYKGKELVMMGSNNYLGLTHHPEVIEAAVKAVRKWGTGCTGSRFLNGNLALHEELEATLAEFFGFEDALVFAAGFMANQGAIAAITGAGEHILCDRENHACIIEGCMLSKARMHTYRHNDLDSLERVLSSIPQDAAKIIITDGVFSMTGHLAHYDKIFTLAKKYSAMTYIDDAHGIGVIGQGGRGTASHFGLPVDILMGTFSKSLASQGGFICASKDVIDWIRHKARTFMFSAALAPASTASALKSLQILGEQPDIVTKVQSNAEYLKAQIDGLGLDTMGTQTCIIPIFIGDDQVALRVCEGLLDLGVFTTPVMYPAVPKGQAVIRCSVMATHTLKDLDRAIAAFSELAEDILHANRNPKQRALIDFMDRTDHFSEEVIR